MTGGFVILPAPCSNASHARHDRPSGNEMFCLNLKGYSPGEFVIGNSVFSMGFASALGAIGRGLMGGEVNEITNIIHEGRIEAFDRMAREAQSHGGVGITGV